ncbi:MAG TPA: TniB family NTP-binding protein [Ktedonobacteraceae bacterium]
MASFVSVSAPESGRGRFNRVDFYVAVLREVNYPFLKREKVGVRVRDLREAMEEALIQDQPYGVIVDEAHHLAKAASGRGLQDQLDHLKYLENRTGVCHVLVGTYEMRRFRTVTAQLAGRSIDVHFPRYDATKKEDREEFRSALWALQRQLPVEEEPHLAEYSWEMLYARSIGCIGLLKLHLNRALSMALSEDAKTVTEKHLKATAMQEDRLKEMLNTALLGEQDLIEPEGADERLLTALGLRDSKVKETTSRPKEEYPSSFPQSKGRKPGDRSPGRDLTGPGAEQSQQDEDGKRVAG